MSVETDLRIIQVEGIFNVFVIVLGAEIIAVGIRYVWCAQRPVQPLRLCAPLPACQCPAQQPFNTNQRLLLTQPRHPLSLCPLEITTQHLW